MRMWQKRLIELPKIPLGNWVQPPIVSNPIWVLSMLIDVFPVTHLISLETFLPSHNLFHFWFCWSVVNAIRLGSPKRLHWALLLTCSQKYPGFLAEHLKGLEYFCGYTTEGLFYSTFDLKCFSIKKRKTTVFWNSPSSSIWDCSTEWLEYYFS